jgi:hypothetical protein
MQYLTSYPVMSFSSTLDGDARVSSFGNICERYQALGAEFLHNFWRCCVSIVSPVQLPYNITHIHALQIHDPSPLFGGQYELVSFSI